VIDDCKVTVTVIHGGNELDSEELKSRRKGNEAHELTSIFITTRKTAQKNKSKINNRKSTIAN
jgi:hypothetical protein